MARMLVALFALAMVFALVAGSVVEEAEQLNVAPLVLPVPGEASLNRVVRGAPDPKCEGKCVKGCVKREGKIECL